MLLKFQDRYKKIVFDMFSLLPNMNQINRLTETFRWYQDADNRILYLWKWHSNNWLGLIGVETKPRLVVIRQLILIPELTDHNWNYFKMLDDLHQIYPKSYFVGNLVTTRICQEWERSHRFGTR